MVCQVNCLGGLIMNKDEKVEYEKEQQRIDFVLSEVDEKIKSMTKDKDFISGDVGQLRTTFWEDVTVNMDEPDDVAETYLSIKQQAELLGERERSYGQIHRQLATLSKLQNSPYFGRIDFKEDGEDTDQIYIGITSFMDKKDENFYIYDWRAPVSSVYYDYSPGEASYKTPSGIIDGELQLKRQFIIRDGSLISLFDTGVTIGDELLLEVLGNNANSMMKSIVATIQKEQNQIIRNENSKILLVQGVAGSGKTSAALQRVAFLLYKHRETLNAENIMLFSPNPLFNSYVSTVLPELGEENMKQSTFYEFLNSRIGKGYEVEDPFSQLEYLLSETDEEARVVRVHALQYKSSIAFKNKMDRYVSKLLQQGMIFKDIEFRNKVFISKEEWNRKFYELDDHISISNRIQALMEWAHKEMKKHAKVERNQRWVDQEIELMDKEDFLSAYHAQENKGEREQEFQYYDQEEKYLRKIVINKYFKPLYQAIRKVKFVDYTSLYKNVFKTECPENLSTKEWDEISKQVIHNLSRQFLSYEDAAPFAYLKEKIEGRKSTTGIRYVFIDEAQDYSDFQMSYINELFPYSKMTLLGDINQAIFAHKNKTLNPSESKQDVERIVLMKSYRSTSEIVEFTKDIAINGHQIEPFNRHGSLPTLVHAKNDSLKHEDLINRIAQWKNKNFHTIAIICKNYQESLRVYHILKDQLDVRIIDKGTNTYEKGISIIPAYLAKGIEFDAVVLYNISIYRTSFEKELFYTACTRAMHELYMYGEEGDSNPFLSLISKDKYTQVHLT